MEFQDRPLLLALQTWRPLKTLSNLSDQVLFPARPLGPVLSDGTSRIAHDPCVARSHRAHGQLISDAIADASIIDVLAAAGMKSPEISVLSEEFLAEIKGMEHKNLALEALKKLLAGEIKARGERNVVEAKSFSERLEAAAARYHVNAITNLEMIQELIDMAKALKASVQRGDDLDLGDEELAFYDALAQNQSAVDVLGNEELRKIAHVLVEQLQKSVTVYWHLKESARAKLRVLVRRILKKYGYPPDLAPVAINTVLSQAETLLKWGSNIPKGTPVHRAQ